MSLRDNNTTVQDLALQVPLTTTRVYQSTAGVAGVLQLYLFIALMSYEMLIPDKPPTGKKLRVLCLLCAATSFFHECLQQLIVLFAGDSDTICTIMMASKSTLFNTVITWNYGFFWLRQRMFYSSPTLRHLRNRAMVIITWVVFALLIIDPIIMLGFQFNGKLYEAKDGVCVVLRIPIVDQLPFIMVAFSYSFIQVTLIFLYFYPLHKRNIPKSASLQPSTAVAPPTPILSVNSQSAWEGSLKKSSLVLENFRRKVTDSFAARKDSGKKIRSLQRRMKRWLTLGIICVIADVISATIIAVFLLELTPASLVTYMFLWHDVSMLVSVLCTVGCFTEYKVMLFPFKAIYKCNRNI